MLCPVGAVFLASHNSLQAKPAAQPTLTTYLTTHPWQATHNDPLVVVSPERTRGKAPANSLAAFDRKVVQVGSLHAYVPTTMVLIDDSLAQPPNMYEGLPPDAKVLYLLRTLSDDQWKTLNDYGLSINDLHGEQKLVLASLLPQHLDWSSYTVDDNGMWGKKVASGSVSGDDLGQVRLKVQRFVELQVHLTQGNSISMFGADRYRGAPGSTFTQHDMTSVSQTDVFGLKIRNVVDNQPKLSDLNYSQLAGRVQTAGLSTVGDALQAVANANHIELIADLRVDQRKLVVTGPSVVAGDLLKAIAECVTGTYRRVGSAYLLTSDLAGMGTRKLRISEWQSRLEERLWTEEDKWRHEIGSQPGFKGMKFGGGDTAPSGDFLANVDKGDQGNSVDLPSAQLSPAVRRLLDQWDHEYTLQPITKDHAGVSSTLHYSFVLPNGTELAPEGQLGPRNMFLPFQAFTPRVRTSPQLPIDVHTADRVELAASASTVDGVRQLVAATAAIGAKRLWLTTEDQGVLAAAVAAGQAQKVAVSLVLRPWRAGRGTDEVDKTLLGEHGAAIGAHMLASKNWSSWLDNHHVLADAPAEELSPTDAALPDRWTYLIALAKTPGLSDVALTETQLPGYEPKRDAWRSALGPLEWAIVGRGYTIRQRLDFLRKFGVDPIDLGDEGYWTAAELRQPFFVDDGLQAIPSVFDDLPEQDPRIAGMGQAWRSFLAERNTSAITALANAIGRPLFIDMRPELVNTMLSGPLPLARWRSGDKLPVGRGQQTNMFVPGEGGVRLWPLPEDTTSEAATYQSPVVQMIATKKFPLPGIVAFDLSAIPPDRVVGAMKRWFVLSR